MGKRHQHTQGIGARQVGGRQKEMRILIISEDTKSSVSYFKAMIEDIQAIQNSVVEGVSTQEGVVEGVSSQEQSNDEFVGVSPESEVVGCGMATKRLLKEAKEIRDKEQTPYDSCWLVFDKDDFGDFNQAIREATDAGFKVAWSNESFELWYLLHFRYHNTALGRKECIKALEEEIRKHDPKFKYEKGSTNMYRTLSQCGDQGQAIKRAGRLRDNYTDKDFAKHNPCTRVDELVKELTDPDKRKEILKRSCRTLKRSHRTK